MHKYHQSGEAVPTPEPVQRAKNLVEEFFGLSLADGEFYTGEFFASISSGGVLLPDQAADYYYACLVSPTGRELERYSFVHKRKDGWATVKGEKGNQWEKSLQIAIDNFINQPKGGFGVLGDFRPTPEKLNAAR
jgi:hypothetical protein